MNMIMKNWSHKQDIKIDKQDIKIDKQDIK